jgi:lambda repressor-like predicted transcriptional regulator
MKTGARQILPPEECVLLRALIGAQLKARARALHEAGWSLAAIAAAWDPPKQRSSVRAWVLSPQSATAPLTQPVPLPPSSPSSSHSASIPAAESLNPSPSAAVSSDPHSASLDNPHRHRRVYDPSAPVVSVSHKRRIAQLAPLARRYRARTSPNNTYARANRELTELCVSLYRTGASVRELSIAAGVTYRAMARRLGR